MVVVINSGVANVGSVANMLRKIGVPSKISADARDVEAADKLILPGVGSFDACMSNLVGTGLVPLLTERVLDRRTPLLGICLGMHLLGTGSEEGAMPGLGWLPASAVRFKFPEAPSYKVPHMGWNRVHLSTEEPLFSGLRDDNRFYFVHSYHYRLDDAAVGVGFSDYGYRFCSSVRRDNILGVQFHPEKSHSFGLRLLKNFVEHY